MIAFCRKGVHVSMRRLYKMLTTPYTSVSVVAAPKTQFAGCELATNFSFMEKNFLRTVIYQWGMNSEGEKGVVDFYAIDYLVRPDKIIKYYGKPHLFSHEAPKHKICFHGTVYNLLHELMKFGIDFNDHEELLTVRKAVLGSKREKEEFRHLCWLRHFNLKKLVKKDRSMFEYPMERIERKLKYLKEHAFS